MDATRISLSAVSLSARCGFSDSVFDDGLPVFELVVIPKGGDQTHLRSGPTKAETVRRGSNTGGAQTDPRAPRARRPKQTRTIDDDYR